MSPEMEVRPNGLRPNLGRQEARVLSPKKEIQAIHKPPLVSQRMSALLCTTYCINGPVRHPIAVLMVSWGGGRWGRWRRGRGCWSSSSLTKVIIVLVLINVLRINHVTYYFRERINFEFCFLLLLLLFCWRGL